MTREQAKDYAKSQFESYLQRQGINTARNFLCPFHDDSNPSMSFDKTRNKVKCFACGVDYDIFGFVGAKYSLSGATVFDKVYSELGITIDGKSETMKPKPTKFIAKDAQDLERIKEILESSKRGRDNPSLYSYTESRGISRQTAERFGLGFMSEFPTKDSRGNFVKFRTVVIGNVSKLDIEPGI